MPLPANKMFDSAEAKRIYILQRRKDRGKTRICSCTECAMPYTYREHSPSLFLCAECYDLEYHTKYGLFNGWQDWLKLCETALIFPAVHRLAGQYYRGGPHSKQWLHECLRQAMRTIEAKEIAESRPEYEVVRRAS